jgi:hypothetical protein
MLVEVMRNGQLLHHCELIADVRMVSPPCRGTGACQFQ